MAEVLPNVLKTTHPRSQSAQHEAQEEKRVAPTTPGSGAQDASGARGARPRRASMRGAAVSPAGLATGGGRKGTVRGAGSGR